MQTLKTAHRLSLRGHDITLLCRPGTTLAKEAEALQINTEQLFSKDIHLPATIRQIIRLLKEQHFEVIHTHLSHDLWSLVPALRWSGNNTRLFMTKRMASSIQKKDIFHRFLYQRLDKVLTISDFINKNIVDTCPVPAEKVFTLYNGLQLEKYAPEDQSREEMRAKLNIAPEKTVIGFVGRFTPKKGLNEFLTAAAQIAQSNSDVCFLVVGGTSHGEEAYAAEVQQKIERLNLQDFLVLPGFQKDVAPYMAAMDLLAFPSHKESFGNILVEAMAMKLPVVASNSGAVPEIVQDGISGFLVPPKDASALKTGLEKLLKRRDSWGEMGAAGRKIAEEKFNYEGHIQALEAHYHG